MFKICIKDIQIAHASFKIELSGGAQNIIFFTSRILANIDR